ncbi:MAG: hypothetical protein IPP36_08905 [Nitrosomonadales bacterium]|nr:hypothetical protein [Nitrosomonadales bacterium]
MTVPTFVTTLVVPSHVTVGAEPPVTYKSPEQLFPVKGQLEAAYQTGLPLAS